MNSRKPPVIYYMTLVRDGSPAQASGRVHKEGGCWVFTRKRDLFDRRIRFNPKSGFLEVQEHLRPEWVVYDKYVYRVEIEDSNGNKISWEDA